MRDFRNDLYIVQKSLKKSSSCSTFVVESRQGTKQQYILKTYSDTSIRLHDTALESDLTWHKSFEHPHVARLLDAGISQKGNVFIVRSFESEPLDLLQDGLSNISQIICALSAFH